uniref:CIDE-N domain-containing protein n=2 Tax=Denticeps clupeoides TaxID=299321 RepID=A0AAY4BHR4_9TELE
WRGERARQKSGASGRKQVSGARRHAGVAGPGLLKCVASMTQQLLGVTPRMRPFRVGNADRTIKKGIMADSLRDLLNKVMDGLHVSCVSALVLDEDGTGVDTEEFFQTLKDNTILIVLEKGQKWTPLEVSVRQGQSPPGDTQGVIGCLNVKATLYGIYSVSYDLRCYESVKTPLREALRWTLFTMQTTGHVLVGTSCYMQKLLDEEENPDYPTLRSPAWSRYYERVSKLLL